MYPIEKIVVVTKKTALEELIERFNTKSQARFYIEHMAGSFSDYEDAHDVYYQALTRLKNLLPHGVRSQFIERAFLPTFTFGQNDFVVTLGPDGLVVNTAKYLSEQAILALNPDPTRIDGILVPYRVGEAKSLLDQISRGHYPIKNISMAEVKLNNGQAICAVNDLFIGSRTHVSARYSLRHQNKSENQSSSGIIVSTGAGSTGWFRSVLTGASEIISNFVQSDSRPDVENSYRFDWESNYLYYSVREPFISKVSSASLTFGRINANESLEVISQMPQNGVIFSDGIESDFLEFNSGSIASIGLSSRKVHLVYPA